MSGRWPVLLGALVLGVSCLSSPAAAADPERRLVRVSSLSIPGTPWHDLWLRFESRLRARNLPGLDLRMFITGEIGSEETALANIRRRRIQIGGFSLQGLATVVPELSVLLAPYLFDSQAQADFVLDEYLTETFTRLLAERNMVLLQWSEVGWTHIYARHPVLTPEAAAGMPMRSSNALGSRVFGEAIGADLIPVTFSEVIPALQTGLIESGQSGVGMYAIGGLAREARHLTLTHHALDTGLIVANRSWFNSLPDDYRQAIVDSMDDVQAGRMAIRNAIAGLQAGFAEQGVTVHSLSDEQMALWRQSAITSHEQMLRDIGGQAEAIYALIQKGKTEFEQR